MFVVLKTSWPLLLGIMLLMVGNGIQGTLLGVRGAIEGFSTFEMSIIMSAYFVGFLGGSRAAPELIRRVGHVRVFAALGSLISAVLVLYPVATDPIAWTVLRVIIGFCFSGVYVTAESWLNNAATNETRGQSLSLYILVQMIGIIAAQGLVVLADPGGFVLFILPSVLVSIAFAPILLSINPTPAFETTRRMTLVELFHKSPLGLIGVAMIGAVFSAQFGMAAVFGTQAGLSVPELSLFIAMFYVGGLVLQYPIGWVSDRMDRRKLINITAGLGAMAALVPVTLPDSYSALLVAAFMIGGMTNPLYALLIAHTNDFLDTDEMAAASAGLMFVNGLGAIAGPVITGWALGVFGPSGFFLYLCAALAMMLGYGMYRATRRPSPSVEATAHYSPVSQSASPVAVDMAQELYVEAVEDSAEDSAETSGPDSENAANGQRAAHRE
jgi:MFS family permease